MKADGGVEDFGAELRRQGHDVELFDKPSPEAQTDFANRLKVYREKVGDPNARLPVDEVRQSLMFKENQAWAEKLKAEDYTVVDTGNPSGAGPSPFYDMERDTLSGSP